MKAPKLLWMSDSPFTTTGFSNQSVSLLNSLATRYGWECHYLGHNYAGQVLPPGVRMKDGTVLNFTIHGGDGSPYCQRIMQQKIKEEKPDIFGMLVDTFMVYPWFLNIDTTPAHTTFYYPSDGGGGLPLDCDKVLRKVKLPIAMSRYAQRQAMEVHGLQTEYIQHATYPEIFFRMQQEKREELRRKWGLQNKFVVGYVARNQGRKMIDRSLRAFGTFAKDHQDAVMLMHTDPNDVAAVFNTASLVQRLNLQNRVLFTGTTYWKGWEQKDMNDLYNLFDCNLLLTSGEGFGIPIIEAMAAEVPSIVTDYTTTHELLIEDGECGIPVKVAAEITGGWNVDRAVADIGEAAAALSNLYSSEQLRRDLGKTGRRKVETIYNWEVAGLRWKELLEKMLQ